MTTEEKSDYDILEDDLIELVEKIKGRFNLNNNDIHDIIEDRCDGIKSLHCCESINGEEIDGGEFEVNSLEEFISMLKKLKSVHINYFDDGPDIDLWVTLEENGN